MCVVAPPPNSAAPQPSHRLPKRAGNVPAAIQAQIAPLPPSARQPAADGRCRRVENFCWKMSFLTAFAVLYVRVSSPLPPRRAGSRGRAAAAAPPESIRKVVRGCSGCFFLLISPNRCSRATSTCDAGEGVSSHPNKPSPPKPEPRSSVGVVLC